MGGRRGVLSRARAEKEKGNVENRKRSREGESLQPLAVAALIVVVPVQERGGSLAGQKKQDVERDGEPPVPISTHFGGRGRRMMMLMSEQ